MALDASDIVRDAREIVATNRLDGVVRVVRGKAEDVELRPALGTADGRADVILSEWMGYALLYGACSRARASGNSGGGCARGRGAAVRCRAATRVLTHTLESSPTIRTAHLRTHTHTPQSACSRPYCTSATRTSGPAAR